jgi:hypothetical protein
MASRSGFGGAIKNGMSSKKNKVDKDNSPFFNYENTVL